MREDQADFGSDLVDLSDISLCDLDGLDGAVLSQALRLLLDPDQEDKEALSGFNAVI
jgi:FXSXX-COOH protein